ncbi:MAG: aspartate kinase [Coriobacteriia bacterium]|nr:aspartate kinase [Coriobacteriia bacterium]
MSLIVMKFGGTSVATPGHIRRVADRLIARHEAGDRVVAVVSAMGKVTDDLVDLAHQLTAHPSVREMDMLLTTGEQVSIALLAMAVQARGVDAISFTGAQVGIMTSSTFSKAQILAIDAACVREALDEGKIVIVAGFQGRTPDGQITTLGRGGSDTTAVALAAGLSADLAEIYTDVAGVYTADPRIVPKARKIDVIGYEEMLEMASSGAGVLSMRSVEAARNHGVIIHCRSSFTDEPGTIVKEQDADMEQAIVSGVTFDTSEVKFTIRAVPDQAGVAAQVFSKLADHDINIDMIIQNISEDGATDISFTAPTGELDVAEQAVREAVEVIGARTWVVDEDVAKISIVGAGMKTQPRVSARMFSALAAAGINIDLISTSPIRLSCVVAQDQMEDAVRALHTEFGLDDSSAVDESN